MKIAVLLLAAAGVMPALAEPVLRSHALMADAFGDGMVRDIAGAGVPLSGHGNPLATEGPRADEVPPPQSPVCALPGEGAAVGQAPTGASVPEPAPEPSAPRLIFAALAAIAWTVGRRLKR